MNAEQKNPRGRTKKKTNPRNLIKETLARGQSALSEYDSKRFLSSFGIPVIREGIAPDAKSAAAEALKIGFPVALKVTGKNLFHKTEVGGVVLNLRGEEEVKEESTRLLKIQGCEALLVQEMVMGDRELVCGLTRDAQFGPCVMFGLGGILTELLGDVVFRIAPLTPRDAQEMMEEIRARRIIEPFRGEPAVDMDVLVQILVALGEIGLQYEGVHEIDINPLKIQSDGKPVSVDALVVLKAGGGTYH
jgi:acetyl-CoA synthetase (ADP-forming)